jgi:ketosteroid isomerase-like protein
MRQEAPIATTPDKTTEVFMHYFNLGNVDDLIAAYYEKNAVIAGSPGNIARGAALKEALLPYFSLNGKISGATRHTLINEDIALLILDWAVEFADDKGNPARYAGTSTDVVRKGADGVWRCVIDNPHNIL